MELIETFLDLCETRNFNRSAERLGITQSTVSGRVRALERTLGSALFVRGRAGTELTTAGLRLEPHARSLRLTWIEAQQAVRQTGPVAMTLRIGIQHDLLENHIADWISALRGVIPESGLYIEADYSTQMCRDVTGGGLDIAIVFTPGVHPDLHFETLGEVEYRMVSTVATRFSEVRADSYILPNYAPAFARTHASLLPLLSGGPVSSGQAAVIRGILMADGGTTFLLKETVAEMVEAATVHEVLGAPRIAQPVYAALHLRHRHRPAYRRILRTLSGQIPRHGVF
ncbi:MAG: LysR family transcriptional regulator [Pseudomonadota bacterium]